MMNKYFRRLMNLTASYGVVTAKRMIAKNSDPIAPIFEQVDYGVVKDSRDVVPILVKTLASHEAHARRADHAI
jgi:hypothetical protein